MTDQIAMSCLVGATLAVTAFVFLLALIIRYEIREAKKRAAMWDYAGKQAQKELEQLFKSATVSRERFWYAFREDREY